MPAVIDVTTLADGTGAGTLRSALAQAETNAANEDTNNTINLTVAGTYHIGQLGALTIFNNAKLNTPNLTIQNTSGGNIAISGDNMSRVFDIDPNFVPNASTINGTVTISGVTIENGLASDVANPDGPNASGGGIRDQGHVSLILNNDIVTNNQATADGGGVSMENSQSTPWTLTLNNTTVSNNHAGDAGGGIEEDGSGVVNINDSTIAGNTTLNQGAGIWLDAIQVGNVFQSATLNVSNSVISGNTAGMLGGGIGNAGNGTVTITNSTVSNNFTSGSGGGFGDENNQGTLIVKNSLFLDNSAGTNGGGIQAGGPSTTITSSEFKGNAAGLGGNPGSGGALFFNGTAVTLSTSTLDDNSATGNGGGIELQTTGASTISNTTIVNNSALNSGGTGNGGGIDAEGQFAGSLSLLNDTITNNFAVVGGGVFYAGTVNSKVSVENTILAANKATGTAPDAFNPAMPFTDLGGNLIGISGAGSGNTGFTAATDQTGTVANPINPLLGPLTNNGGPVAGASGDAMTVETEAELLGSPALGNGVTLNAPTSDERGDPRTNTIDAGAFQFEDATLKLNISTQTTLTLGASETVSVTVTNTSANTLPADNSILTVTTSGGLNSGGTQTFTLAALGSVSLFRFLVQ